MNQKRTPLFDQLKKHSSQHPISFHVPGHKYGELLSYGESEFFKDILKLDATELGSLDDLHSPGGVILESQRLLANLYGVSTSYFLVNGSTAGNLAMIMAAAEENDTVLVQRNCHKSILNGISLAKADPVFLAPEYNHDWGVAGGVPFETVKEAIGRYPHAKALILTYPNYYGMVSDLEQIITHAHHYGIPVLVDEAHGAHFIGAKCFPASAVQLKADIVIQSAHKTLPAMTMGAYLHFNSKLVNEKKLSSYLGLLQSSSPSYPIMASLDMARAYLASFSDKDADKLYEKIENFRNALNRIRGIKVLSYKNNIGDPLKVTIQSTTSLSGYELQQILEQHGIYAEMADPYNVLLVFPLLKSNMDYSVEGVINCLEKELKTYITTEDPKKKIIFSKEPVSELSFNQKKREGHTKKTVLLEDSVGRISAQQVTPYPPGIPLLFPGEPIHKEDIQNIRILLEAGARFQNEENIQQGTIKIYEQLEEVL
ncbi:aminotransferase class I/II-fold pyridoxal phosphate-dependent enzyme [Bacillus sp. ISL-47]|uniref:aminotransferase class I/II-fold pyridoxal phosphate-dependent enzyme n=1 Tax=Bacillus sp. ISL-47 TaxID=2819130 RepID=UPI001BED171B|nr:aminotransferase class I/II-fold pyridoxal phosphate-dependent enzyme [Bacillus sp. ISL-47]MBT2690799.1 aminotransferase class I/II-fold pyridoxal phosphate-dependent enzyme [Bacillus sp. ISL-47]MBT2709510.1 aminotransferase class I/II-fold pyridoxal phosphate-dependent enzyme [Pseudomonas sp. ISL-84]